jgi:hypothetical protein
VVHKLSWFHCRLRCSCLLQLLAWRPEAPNSKARSSTRLVRSDRMPNRHRRPKPCRSSYPRGASNWASAGQARRPAHNYF